VALEVLSQTIARKGNYAATARRVAEKKDEVGGDRRVPSLTFGRKASMLTEGKNKE